jgi:hypothetical protein
LLPQLWALVIRAASGCRGTGDAARIGPLFLYIHCALPAPCDRHHTSSGLWPRFAPLMAASPQPRAPIRVGPARGRRVCGLPRGDVRAAREHGYDHPLWFSHRCDFARSGRRCRCTLGHQPKRLDAPRAALRSRSCPTFRIRPFGEPCAGRVWARGRPLYRDPVRRVATGQLDCFSVTPCCANTCRRGAYRSRRSDRHVLEVTMAGGGP